MSKLCSAIIVFVFVVAVTVYAGDTGNFKGETFFSTLKGLGALFFVLALILICAWLARRYLRLSPHGSVKGDQIRILSSRALGPKRSMHLVEVEGQKLLVGSSEEGVTLLKDYSLASNRE